MWRSFYYEQLNRVFELFDRERVLVLQFERCRSDPAGQMEATCRFLGLEPFDELPDQLVRERSPREKPSLPERMRAELVERLSDDVSRLIGLCRRSTWGCGQRQIAPADHAPMWLAQLLGPLAQATPLAR